MIERQREFYKEEEINLYDILKVLDKYKKKMLLIIIIGILISFGAALVSRKFRKESTFQEYRIGYSALESDYYYQLIGLNYSKFDISDILQVEKYIDRFLAIPELKKLYEEQKGDNTKIELYKKIDFINRIIKVGNVDGYNVVTTTLDSDIDIAPRIIETYFSILQEEIPDKIKSLLLETKEMALQTNSNAVEHLNDVKVKLANVVRSNSIKANNIEDLDFLVSLKYPLLISDKNLYQNIYAKTTKEITGVDVVLREGKINQIIEKRGSMVVTDSRSNAASVLLAGSFLSVLLAFLFVIITEVKNSYKKYRTENKLLEKK